MQKSCSSLSLRAPCKARQARRTTLRCTAAQRPKSGTQTTNVYIGKGKYVKDDPSKYPGRDNWLTGGWAGGEVALKEGLNGAEPEAPASKWPRGEFSMWPRKAPKGKGKDDIYIGYSKDETQARRVGTQGAVIKGDARKYPKKDNWLTGGFAGGEQGLKQFVEKGDIELTEKGRKQFSPLLFAMLVSASATIAALLFTEFSKQLPQ